MKALAYLDDVEDELPNCQMLARMFPMPFDAYESIKANVFYS